MESARLDTSPENVRGIVCKPGECTASLDGAHTVPLPEWLAQNIATSLRIQEKVEDALAAGHRKGFLRTLAMFNCRKSMAVVRGTTTLRDAVQNKEDVHGVEALIADVMAIQNNGSVPVVGTLHALHVDEYLEEHPQELPAVVHVFSAHNKQVGTVMQSLFSGLPVAEQLVRSLGRIHTFIVLGKDDTGRYVCFHKQGSDIAHQLELISLEGVMKSLFAEGDEERMSLSFVGKIENQDVGV